MLMLEKSMLKFKYVYKVKKRMTKLMTESYKRKKIIIKYN